MWKTVRLEDVCTIYNGGTPKSKTKSYWEGDIKWLTPKDMGKLDGKFVSNTARKITHDGLNNSSAKLVPANSIILSCRAPIGYVFINECDMSFNQGCKGLVPSNEILVEYLYYFLFSSKQLLNELGTGTTFKEISSKTLSNVSFSYPPLAEQERIVAKLDVAFAEIDKAVEVVNERYNNTNILIATAQNALFDDMPLSIPRLKLSEAAKFENGDRGKNYPSKKYQLSEGIPFVNAGDFSLDGDITRDGMAYISEERFDLLGAGKFKKDDVLFCLRGSLGKSAINKTLKRGAIASSLVIIRALQDVYPDYLFAFIRSDIVKKYISETAGGAAQPNLSAKVVMGYEIPTPSLQEQEAIADKFLALRLQGLKAISLIKKKKSELMALKIAILTQELQSPQREVA